MNVKDVNVRSLRLKMNCLCENCPMIDLMQKMLNDLDFKDVTQYVAVFRERETKLRQEIAELKAKKGIILDDDIKHECQEDKVCNCRKYGL